MSSIRGDNAFPRGGSAAGEHRLAGWITRATGHPVGLDHFFTEPTDRPTVAVVRARKRLRLSIPPATNHPNYFFQSLDFRATNQKMDAYLRNFRRNRRNRKLMSTRVLKSSM